MRAIRARPALVDVLGRLAATDPPERVHPLTTQEAAVAARAARYPQDPGPELWPVVGVEVHHLGAHEEQALVAVARQQVEQPWFRPVLLASEAAVAAARETGCPFDLVPEHAATPEVVGQRLADLVTGFGAQQVWRAGPDGLAPEQLEALRVLADRHRRARGGR
ncbi:hypothetical protein SAMN05445756_1309 [Kytococcus aerolatus]|uniref:Uncharacterized protein n=1 Tax=Kytococcus aerolatus TaxID=592308 RepID=A0A212THQ3_9MICO|nr:hypothetical protein SAMN05445756_1309 [Kytococcus aerolatus]